MNMRMGASISTSAIPSNERVYTLTNVAEANAVAVFARQGDGGLLPLTSDPTKPVAADGTVNPLPPFLTRGLGAGGGIFSQGAVTLSDDGRVLLAVSPGSNEVSSFLVTPSGLRLASTVSSGGVLPVSVTSFGNLAYVVNMVRNGLPPVTPGLDAEGTGQIAGFSIGLNGVLTPIEGSERALSSVNSNPAQIAFNPDGTLLVVTEITASRITVFQVEEDGRPGTVVENPSAGQSPFGFAFNSRGFLIVSEAGDFISDNASVSSYEVNSSGQLSVISASVPTKHIAACWIVNTPDARYAYTTNTPSGVITGFSVSSLGELTILDADGRTASLGAGSVPVDMVISADGKYLDVLAGGSKTIMTFRIEGDGSLTLLTGVGNLPPVAFGLGIGSIH
ncbi:MAG: lactonase family protein [Actinomycetota bacterium]